jgi:hypothetical protein
MNKQETTIFFIFSNVQIWNNLLIILVNQNYKFEEKWETKKGQKTPLCRNPSLGFVTKAKAYKSVSQE